MKYEIKTQVMSNGDLSQTVNRLTEDASETLRHQVIQISDQQVREAMIKLGWTPPQDGQLTEKVLELGGKVE